MNTKTSTEANLVGTSEYVPFNFWVLMFMGARGFLVNKDILFRDNQSTIGMKVNGRNSCTENTRHTNIRYLFVKYRVEKMR